VSTLRTIPAGPLVVGGALYAAGRAYALEGPHTDPETGATAIELWPLSHLGDRTPTSYTLTAEPDADPARTVPGGLACDCPDFVFRHAGTGTRGCKHLRAAVAAGLISPIPPR
jgi:hypothetical protein